MNLDNLSPGKNLPEEVNVVIEIPSHGSPVKYELDKDSGALIVDRFLTAPMFYPCNYGFVPHTLSDDGDPVDVLVVTPMPLISGSIISSRPVGMLKMSDEAGMDAKILAVPSSRLHTQYDDVASYKDLPKELIQQITHFFEHYKKLEPNKWVKVEEWVGVKEAQAEIVEGVKRYESAKA